MQETGIVMELRDDKVLVEVERIRANGCGCGVSTQKEACTVEARNLCEARIHDRVMLETTYDAAEFRKSIEMAGTFTVFILGSTLGKFIFSQTEGKLSIISALALGLVLGAAAFALIRLFYKRKPLPGQAACKVLWP
jgi:hypothetical protein